MRSSSLIVSAAPYSVVLTRRRHQQQQQRKHYRSSRIGIASEYDEENSSCGEEEDFVRRRKRHLWRQSTANTNSIANDSSLIPRQNARIRNIVDRIYQEIFKAKGKFYLLTKKFFQLGK